MNDLEIPDSSITKLIEANEGKPPMIVRANICGLERTMAEMEGSINDKAMDSWVTNHFAPGVYAREFNMPAGTVIIGKIHKQEHLSIVTHGKAVVVTEFGTEIITGPCTFMSPIGTKRALYVIEDMRWTTIHPTNEMDVSKIEAEAIAASYDEINLLELAS